MGNMPAKEAVVVAKVMGLGASLSSSSLADLSTGGADKRLFLVVASFGLDQRCLYEYIKRMQLAVSSLPSRNIHHFYSTPNPSYPISSTMSESYELVEPFTRSDADLVILCPAFPGEVCSRAFKIKRYHLAAASAVFEHMLKVGSPDEIWEDLPVVRLVEPAIVVEVLLRAACNTPEQSINFNAKDNWEVIFNIWDAANKYRMNALRVQARTSLMSDHILFSS